MTAGVSLGAIITPPILYLASSRVGWMYTARVRLAGRAGTVRRDDDVHVLIVRIHTPGVEACQHARGRH